MREASDADARAAAIKAIEAYEAAVWSEPRPSWEVPRETRTEFLRARADLIRAILALEIRPDLPRGVTRGSYVYVVYLEEESQEEAGDDWAVEHEMSRADQQRRFTWRLLVSGVGHFFDLND